MFNWIILKWYLKMCLNIDSHISIHQYWSILIDHHPNEAINCSHVKPVILLAYFMIYHQLTWVTSSYVQYFNEFYSDFPSFSYDFPICWVPSGLGPASRPLSWARCLPISSAGKARISNLRPRNWGKHLRELEMLGEETVINTDQ
jgi:hypothetical protein